MIDLTRLNKIVAATNNLASLQQQVNQSGQAQQAAQSAPQAQNPTAYSTMANQLFAQLGALINSATTVNTPGVNPITGAPNTNADLQKQAALLSAEVRALISNADRLEAELNMTPTPEYVGVEELLQEMRDILSQLDQELTALQEKVREKKAESKLKLEQKPTSRTATEDAAIRKAIAEGGDNPTAFNTTLTTV